MLVDYSDVANVIADIFDVSALDIIDYLFEDNIGGFSCGDTTQVNPDLGFMSCHESEGRILYSLVRAFKPKVIVEVGSFHFASTQHLALGCEKNGFGVIYAIDPGSDTSFIPDRFKEYIIPIKESGLEWTPDKVGVDKIDFLFEDGSHNPNFTLNVLTLLKPYLNNKNIVASHDWHAEVYQHIKNEFREVMGEESFSSLISPSFCGIGVKICV